MHSSVISHVLVGPAQNMKQSLSSLQKKKKKNTQTHVHTLTVEKRKAVLVPSEGQTSQVFSADKNDLAYSTKHHHLSRGLVHTLSIIHVRVMEALCGPGQSLGGLQRVKQRH